MIESIGIVSRSGLKPLIVQTNSVTKDGTEMMISFAKGFQEEQSFFETSEHRFLYLPLESKAYVVIVTERHSNVVQDLEVLGLLVDILAKQFTEGVTESGIVNSYERVLFVIDEVIPFGTPVTPLSIVEIEKRLKMYSVLEELENEQRKEKEEAARRLRHERELEQQRQKAKEQIGRVIGAVRDIGRDGPSARTVSNLAQAGVGAMTGQSGSPTVPKPRREFVRPDAPAAAPAAAAPVVMAANAMTLDMGMMGQDAWD
ncbi:Coatomer subunit, delta (CopD) [Carpediemonas membranifera]|uniref:Coatomer subunit delta n=1 Tax=Carpediemonas membranifera TaxID=201153 RepID=A0A8J6BAW2_9EUKA|nr:Coatomer subunit, delta (CopD) [Carpediemonas membranifera]|eukprot:KAG9396899.1 Coatomer subunit, delta (CopD) [Carpediemonas membranifera]